MVYTISILTIITFYRYIDIIICNSFITKFDILMPVDRKLLCIYINTGNIYQFYIVNEFDYI